MTPSKRTNEHLKVQHLAINPYVKLTRLTEEDIEKYTGKINAKTVPTNLIEVKIETEDSTESTTFSNYSENDDDITFICKECNAHFDDFEEFVVHKNLSHKNKPYVCDICNAQFVLSAHLNLHYVKHVNCPCLRNSSINPSEIQSSSRSNLTTNRSRIYNTPNSTTALAKNSCNTIASVNLPQNNSK